MTEGFSRTPPYIKGVDIPIAEASSMWEFIIEKGRESLSDTAFVTGGEFGQADIDSLKSFFQEVFEKQKKEYGDDGAVFNASLLEHLSLAERMGDEVAEVVGVSKFKLKAILLTHDLGRLMSHRRGRNNAIERSMGKQLGFSEEFIEIIPPDTLWTDDDEESLEKRLERITSENNGIVGLVEIIDVLAKWDDKAEGLLRKSQDIISKSKSAQKTPDKEKMWPSEYVRQRKIYSQQGENSFQLKYGTLIDWFEEKTGKPIDEYIVKTEESIRENPLEENWI